MNAQVSPAPELLPPLGTAIAEYSTTCAGLAELRSQLAGVSFDCSTTAGDKQARETRRALVSLRTTLEERRRELKAPLLERERLIDAEAKRLTGEILDLEMPIDLLIKAEERRKEEARRERERAEAARLAEVNAQIDNIRALPLSYVAADAATIREAIAALESRNLAEVFLPADLPRAEQAYEAAMAGLRRALESREAADAERARLDAERAELEAQRAAAAEAQRIAEEQAAAAREEADRLAREERERQAEADRVERERVAAEQAREQQRLAAERAELERQQQAIRDREAAEQAERERVAREQAEAAARAEAERQAAEEQAAIDAAVLIDAANDACHLLYELGQQQHLTTRKLVAALLREGVAL